jgi:glycosyltransferase involved in cell wall biosynthesis
MRILRIYTRLPPLLGGMEKHIYNLTKQQLKKHKVTVFYNDGEAITSNDKKISDIKFYSFKPQAFGVILFYLGVIKELLFNKQQFDIIHIHGDWSSLLFVRFIKKLTRAKLVVLSLHDQLLNKFTHQRLLPKLVQNVDLIFSTGYDTAKTLEKLTGKKVIVQPSGINEIFFEKFDKEFNNEKFTIVTVANLFPKKNIELVLEIAKENPEYDFLIIGKGPHRKILENIINKNNIKNVKLLGFKTPKEVREYYRKSDIYLLTSFAEGTPTSALEAMACGLPIISSNAGGLGNIVKEKINGFVIKDFDKYKFMEKINLLYKNIDLRKKIYENNIQLSQNYTWENVASNITVIMEQELNAKKN